MSNKSIEQKLAELAPRVEVLEAKAAEHSASRDSWREAMGMMKENELFDEAMQWDRRGVLSPTHKIDSRCVRC
jgi:hypothetical protein